MDQFNHMLLLDILLSDKLKGLALHKNIFALHAPRTASAALCIPKPVIATMCNYFNTKSIIDNIKLSRMEALYDV